MRHDQKALFCLLIEKYAEIIHYYRFRTQFLPYLRNKFLYSRYFGYCTGDDIYV